MQKFFAGVFAGLGLLLMLGLAGLGAVELRNRLVLAEGVRPAYQHVQYDFEQ